MRLLPIMPWVQDRHWGVLKDSIYESYIATLRLDTIEFRG